MKHIEDLQWKKVYIEKSASNNSKKHIDKDATIGLQHVQVAIRLDDEIAPLHAEESNLDVRVKFSKVQFEKLKTEFYF